MNTDKKIYKVDAVIRPEKLEELKDKLYEIGVTGITVTEVYGCGLTHGQEQNGGYGIKIFCSPPSCEIIRTNHHVNHELTEQV